MYHRYTSRLWIFGYIVGCVGASTSTSNSGSPCARVSQLVESQLPTPSGSTEAESKPTVPAKVAYDCLSSLPLNKTSALEYLDLAEPYIEWQTNLEFVKDPPAEFAEKVQEPYDFWSHWSELRRKVTSDHFENQYDFDRAVYKTVQNVHDSHFKLVPVSVGELFNFGRHLPLVSVSMNGSSLPEVYAYDDILRWKKNGSSISRVTRINNKEVIEFLTDWSKSGSGVQDPDALWNSVFYSPAQFALSKEDITGDHAGYGSFIGGDNARWEYPGPETSLTFENGTTSTFENFAVVLQPDYFDSVKDGAGLSKKCCKPDPTLSLNIWDSLNAQPELPPGGGSGKRRGLHERSEPSSREKKTHKGYPPPVVDTGDATLSGYFLNEKDVSDVAVLAVRTFQPSDSEKFKECISEFLQKAKQGGKRKLVVDLSANSGGDVVLGYSLYKALFPNDVAKTPQRYRAHEGLDLLGQEYSRMLDLGLLDFEDDDVYNLMRSVVNYQGFEIDSTTRQNFSSWDDFFGSRKPNPKKNSYTSPSQFNQTLQDPSWDNFTDTQPFKSADIAVVTDGFCGSTCSIFAYLMKHQANATFISLGGRPNRNISQAVGGVKGANYLDMYGFFEYGQAIVKLSNQSSTLIDKWEPTILSNYTALPGTAASQARVNSKDGLMVDDESGTPLHFIYEPADCRMFYTPEMILDQSQVWKRVASSVWSDKSFCVRQEGT